jgi:Bacterial SH3 domain
MPGGPPSRPTEVRHIPAGGISVYAAPDASGAPIAELPSGYEVSIVGRRPPWVHIQGGDGLDGWVDGTALAGIAVGAHQVEPPPMISDNSVAVAPGSVVIEKKGSTFLFATGPVLGLVGAAVAILGAALPWVKTAGVRLDGVDAFDLPVRILNGWDQAAKGGYRIGWVILILAAIGGLVSLISGGGIVRRVLGFVIVIMAIVYVLQTQDFITSADRGLGTGFNVWDLVDYGVLVTFGGGLLMVFSPSR